jgi:uncharacterized protein
MRLEPLPAAAAWQHVGARSGFEVLFSQGSVLDGHTTAAEGSDIWSVHYVIELDAAWQTVRVEVTGRSPTGLRQTVLERLDGDSWTIDGVPVPQLSGCVDVDLESSAVTNTLPIHRLEFAEGVPVQCPAAYVRADLTVGRLEQTYTARAALRFDYSAPAFAFAAELRYDGSGLIVDYPGIATRVR